ncbi:C-type mannose receptor 2-like [Mytilus trossulus]|uniref:C-type mannose receptor 2-like n=1 Tax=Mytilus trossulus TaxID=6551 RepID=UPI0030063412
MHHMCSYYSYNGDDKLCLIHSNREEDTTLITDSKWQMYEPVLNCPPDWNLFEGNCYFFSQDEKSWDDAKVYCVEQQSMLVEVMSENENNFLKGKAAEHQSSFWIGATDTKTEGVWLWGTSQTVVTFTDWNKPPDNHRGNQDCVQLQNSEEYGWDDSYCDTNFRGSRLCSYNGDDKLCLIHSNREEDTTLISDSKWRIYEPDCPPSWDLFEGNCYLVSQDQKYWHDSKVYCEEQQSMLVEVISENENNFLKGMADEDMAFYWIGATDIDTEGVWIWDKSQTVLTFTGWFPGQPDSNFNN